LLRTLEPALTDLAERGIQVVVESARARHGISNLDSDFIIEFGDARVRLIVLPGVQLLSDTEGLVQRAQSYLLETPDTDALALIFDDENLPTLILDIYLASDPSQEFPDPSPFPSAIGHYFLRNTLAIDIPDFRNLVHPPSVEDLEILLSRSVSDSFEREANSQARIPEKINALASLGPRDLVRLIEAAKLALRGEPVASEDVVGRDLN
jgi:hypothetical protein